jgi:hypothetical protein
VEVQSLPLLDLLEEEAAAAAAAAAEAQEPSWARFQDPVVQDVDAEGEDGEENCEGQQQHVTQEALNQSVGAYKPPAGAIMQQCQRVDGLSSDVWLLLVWQVGL